MNLRKGLQTLIQGMSIQCVPDWGGREECVAGESDSFYNSGRDLVVVSHDFIVIVWSGRL